MYLKTIINPLEPYNGKVKQVSRIPGKPVFHYAQAELMLPKNETGIIVNGRVLDETEFNLVPNSDDFIIVVPLAAGGGDNNILMMAIIVVAMMYLGPQVGAWASSATGAVGVTTAAATWNFWGWAAYIGLQVAGGYLMQQLAGKPQKTEDISPTYGWGQIQPLYGNNQPIPVTFGRVKTAGQIVATYVDYDGQKQYMNLLIEAGEGPCDYVDNGEDNNCTGITNIKIDGNNIANYSGVQIYKRAGLNNQSAIPNFGDNIAQKQLSYLMNNQGSSEWYTDTTANDGNGLRVVFYFPSGLQGVEKDGDTWILTEKILIQYKLESESEWKTWEEYEINRETAKAFWITRRLDNIPEGTYNVRCKCTFIGEKRYITSTVNGVTTTQLVYYPTLNTSRYAYLVYWSSLDSVTYDDLIRPNKILLGIRALATDQLSNSFTVTFELVRSNVWVFNPDSGFYEQKPANNPAWAAYWALHRVYYLENINTHIMEYVVRGVKANRLIFYEFERWAAFCEERGLEVNIIFDTKQQLDNALKVIAESGRGMIIPRSTRHGCVFDEPAQKDEDGNIIPAQVFNMSNIVPDSFSEQFVDISERSTAIEVTFPDRDNDFEKTVIQVPADNLDENEAQENTTQVTWNWCTSYAQAWREAKYRLRLNRHLNCTNVLKSNVNAISCSLGQVVMTQHDVPAFGFGGRIIGVTENTITLDQSILNDIQGNPYYDPEKNYQVLIWLNNNTHIYRNVQSVDETGTIVTFAASFANDIDSHAIYIDSDHFETDGNMTGVYTAGKEIQLIYDYLDFVVKVVGSSYNSGTNKTIVEISDNPVIDDSFTIRFAWTMPKVDDQWNFGELHKHSKPIKIGSIQRSGDLEYTISGLEYNDAIYTEAEDVPDIEYGYLEPIFEVSSLTVKEETFKAQKDGTRVSRLNCSWLVPINKNADNFIIYFSTDDGVTWEYSETIPPSIMQTYIDNVKTGSTYKVKVIIRKGVLNSTGVISSAITIIGKDVPPSDVENLSITQNGADLKFTVALVPDPDIAYYEIRQGPSIENSEIFLKIDRNKGTETQETPRTGNLTFWARACDNSGLFSENPARRDIEVFASVPKNFIWKEAQDLSTWTAQNMHFTPWHEWEINSKEVIDDYDDILDMFADSSITMADNPQLTLPIVDLGEYVLQSNCYYIDPLGGIHLKSVVISDDYDDLLDFFATTDSSKVTAQYMMTTYLNPQITYNQSLNNRVDTYYRTRADGDQWSDWKDASDKQFTGRRIEVKLVPVSLDGLTNVVISATTIEVDVPDRSEIFTNIDVPFGGVHIQYSNRYYFPPTPRTLTTRDFNGIMMPNQQLNKEREGSDIKIYDYSGNEIAGIIDIIEIWGY